MDVASERGATARAATVADIPEIVRLVRGMYADVTAMYNRPEPLTDSAWEARVATSLAARLWVDGAAFVIEAQPGTLAAVAVGRLVETFPSPRRPSNFVGYIEWVATDQSQRGHGFGTAVTEAIVQWFRQQDASVVDLHASSAAESLYLRLGFEGDGPRGLSLRLQPVPGA